MKNRILVQLKEFYKNSNISQIIEIRFKDGIFVGSVKIDDQELVVKFFEKISVVDCKSKRTLIFRFIDGV